MLETPGHCGVRERNYILCRHFWTSRYTSMHASGHTNAHEAQPMQLSGLSV